MELMGLESFDSCSIPLRTFFLKYFPNFSKYFYHEIQTINCMSKESLDDLRYELELKNAEIDELNMELQEKIEEINKLKLYSTKLKYEKKNLEDKLDTKIDYDKARIKELDDLQEKIIQKEAIIEDKHDQVKYLRSLIDDYKGQLGKNTENLEVQLRKISKSYDNLLAQKDAIIQKQDEQIANLIKSNEEIVKSNKTNIISLKLQNEKYQEIIDKFTKTS